MTYRPILFSGPMVNALVDDRKTQTRRLATSPLRRVEIGDRLWVREEWKVPTAYDDLKPSEMGGEEAVRYSADGSIFNLTLGDRTTLFGRRRPGMFMPRWASRLTLIVTDVRVQPLRSITEPDAIAEGCDQFVLDPADDVLRIRVSNGAWLNYASLWDSLHNVTGERWSDDPQVVALTFTVERRNIDA